MEGYFLFATFSLYSFFFNFASSLEMAPSATARMVNGLPALVRASITFLIALMSYGISGMRMMSAPPAIAACSRSEEHTSELQSRFDLVCRLLLEKKDNQDDYSYCFLIIG